MNNSGITSDARSESLEALVRLNLDIPEHCLSDTRTRINDTVCDSSPSEALLTCNNPERCREAQLFAGDTTRSGGTSLKIAPNSTAVNNTEATVIDNRTQICFEFTKGQCTRGDKCKYSHDLATIVQFNSKEKGICFDFLRNQCSRGLLCRFSHDLSNIAQQCQAYGGSTMVTASAGSKSGSKPNAICYDFVKGLCQRGGECKYSHDLTLVARMARGNACGAGGVPASPKTEMCYDFLRGRCNRGATCKYSHDIVTLHNLAMMGPPVVPQPQMHAGMIQMQMQMQMQMSSAPGAAAMAGMLGMRAAGLAPSLSSQMGVLGHSSAPMSPVTNGNNLLGFTLSADHATLSAVAAAAAAAVTSGQQNAGLLGAGSKLPVDYMPLRSLSIGNDFSGAGHQAMWVSKASQTHAHQFSSNAVLQQQGMQQFGAAGSPATLSSHSQFTSHSSAQGSLGGFSGLTQQQLQQQQQQHRQRNLENELTAFSLLGGHHGMVDGRDFGATAAQGGLHSIGSGCGLPPGLSDAQSLAAFLGMHADNPSVVAAAAGVVAKAQAQLMANLTTVKTSGMNHQINNPTGAAAAQQQQVQQVRPQKQWKMPAPLQLEGSGLNGSGSVLKLPGAEGAQSVSSLEGSHELKSNNCSGGGAAAVNSGLDWSSSGADGPVSNASSNSHAPSAATSPPSSPPLSLPMSPIRGALSASDQVSNGVFGAPLSRSNSSQLVSQLQLALAASTPFGNSSNNNVQQSSNYGNAGIGSATNGSSMNQISSGSSIHSANSNTAPCHIPNHYLFSNNPTTGGSTAQYPPAGAGHSSLYSFGTSPSSLSEPIPVARVGSGLSVLTSGGGSLSSASFMSSASSFFSGLSSGGGANQRASSDGNGFYSQSSFGTHCAQNAALGSGSSFVYSLKDCPDFGSLPFHGSGTSFFNPGASSFTSSVGGSFTSTSTTGLGPFSGALPLRDVPGGLGHHAAGALSNGPIPVGSHGHPHYGPFVHGHRSPSMSPELLPVIREIWSKPGIAN